MVKVVVHNHSLSFFLSFFFLREEIPSVDVLEKKMVALDLPLHSLMLVLFKFLQKAGFSLPKNPREKTQFFNLLTSCYAFSGYSFSYQASSSVATSSFEGMEERGHLVVVPVSEGERQGASSRNNTGAAVPNTRAALGHFKTSAGSILERTPLPF